MLLEECLLAAMHCVADRSHALATTKVLPSRSGDAPLEKHGT